MAFLPPSALARVGSGIQSHSEEEQNSRLRNLLGYGGSLLGVVGGALDTYSGASTARDLLAGKGLGESLDQLLDPFNETKRVTGREMLRANPFTRDLIGNEDNWGNFGAGFIAEVALDPLTYATFGASALSKLGKAGKFLQRPELLEKIGKGARSLRVGGTFDDYLQLAKHADAGKVIGKDANKILGQSNLSRLDEAAAGILQRKNPAWKDYLHKPTTAKSGLASGEAIEALRKEGDSLGSSFRFMGKPVGKGKAAKAAAQWMDNFVAGIKQTMVGQGFQKVFDPAIKGFTSNRLGQTLARMDYYDTNEIGKIAKQTTRDLYRKAEDLGLQDDPEFLRYVIEVTNDAHDDLLNAIDVNDVIPGVEKNKLKSLLDQFHQGHVDALETSHRLGNDLSEFTTLELERAGQFGHQYAPRQEQIAAGKFKQASGRILNVKDWHNQTRVQALRGAVSGTKVFRDAVMDHTPQSIKLNDAIEEFRKLTEFAGDEGYRSASTTKKTIHGKEVEKARKKVIDLINKQYGPHTLKAPWRTKDPDSLRETIVRHYDRMDENGNPLKDAKGQTLQGDRYADMANLWAKYTRDERAAGLFGNDPLIDNEIRTISEWRSNKLVDSTYRMIGEHSVASPILDEEFSNLGVSVGKFLKSRGLREGDEAAGALQEIHKHLTEAGEDIRGFVKAKDLVDEIEIPNKIYDKANKAEDAAEFLDNYRTKQAEKLARQTNDEILMEVRSRHIPQDLDKAFEKLRNTVSREPSDIVKKFDSYTNWFKAVNTVVWSVPPLSAFAFRNFYAGQFSNWAGGAWSIRAFQNSVEFFTKKTVTGAKEWAPVRKEYMRRLKQEGMDEVGIKKAMEKFSDKDATEVIEDLVYQHDVLGPNLGGIGGAGVELGHIRPEQADEIPTGRRMVTREDIAPDSGVLGALGKLTARTYRTAAGMEPGTSLFGYKQIRGVGTDPVSGKPRITGTGPAQRETRFGLAKAGEGVNGFVESSNRGTAFFHQLANGVDPAEAAARTNALQVDYSWRKYTDVEKDFLTRAFPFYKWTRGMLPHTLKEIMEKPGGRIAQSIRAQNRLSGSGEEYVLDRLQHGAAIPISEMDEEGNQKYLTKIDLPFEVLGDVLKPGPMGLGYGKFAGGTLKNTVASVMGLGHPLPKFAAELATNKRMFDGRDLERLDGSLARIYSNIGEIFTSLTGKEPPKVNLQILKDTKIEHIASTFLGSPLNRLRTATDTRDGLGLGKKAINLGTGGRVTTLNKPQLMEIEIKEKLEDAVRNQPGIAELIKPYIRDADLLSPRVQQMMQTLKQFQYDPDMTSTQKETRLRELGLIR